MGACLQPGRAKLEPICNQAPTRWAPNYSQVGPTWDQSVTRLKPGGRLAATMLGQIGTNL